MPKMISVVVPVYNNAPTLAETCQQIVDVHAHRFDDLDLEIVFVNDGSKDDSWEELKRLKTTHGNKIVLLNLSRNFGQMGALFAGFNRARGDAVVCVSADLQDPISLMGDMVDYWKQGTEIVIGYRQNRTDGLSARLGSNIAYAIVRLTYPQLPKGGFDYWLMSKRVNKLFCSLKGRHTFLQGYLLSLGFRKILIPYTRRQRKVGKSGFKLRYKIKIIIDFLVDGSYLPIRFMSGFGAITACCGFVYSLLIAYGWYMHRTPFPGWAPLMILVLIIGGMIMIMQGVIGEYIWRMHDNIKEFPLFIIDEEISKDTASSQRELDEGTSRKVIDPVS
jgi:glycosyltransferase involved in cell wall biosynthesis